MVLSSRATVPSKEHGYVLREEQQSQKNAGTRVDGT